MATEFSIQTGTRGTAYGFSDFTLTNDTLTINVYKPIPVFIDEADLAQCTLVTIGELAERQGQAIDEWIETAVLADHGSWTNFDNTAIGGSAGNITVAISNIDDIVRGIKREIIEANGKELMQKYGAFVVWRAADFEILEAYLQSTGHNLADETLKKGIMTQEGYYAMGVYHYVSNSHTAGHVFAGVKKVATVGILSATYGKIKVTEDPNLQSGKGVISRVDYGLNVKAGHTTLVFDVLVA